MLNERIQENEAEKIISLTLATAMALSLAAPATAADPEPQRGVLTYQEIIAPQYKNTLTFSEGLAAGVPNAGSKDSGSLAGWTTDAVDYVRHAHVMNGSSDNTSHPLHHYTCQQSYITIYHLFQTVLCPGLVTVKQP